MGEDPWLGGDGHFKLSQELIDCPRVQGLLSLASINLQGGQGKWFIGLEKCCSIES